jgi:hypothetical protein
MLRGGSVSDTVGVRQVVQLAVSVVRLWSHGELHSCDCLFALQKSANDSMHPIHDSAIGGQDDRVRGVYLLDEPCVQRELPDCERLSPVDGVDLPQGIERHLLDRQLVAELDQPSHIPGVDAPCTGLGVVLRSHARLVQQLNDLRERRARLSRLIAGSGAVMRGQPRSCSWLRDDLVMKYSTAMSRLTDVVDGLDRAEEWPETTVTAAFVFGRLLDGTADLDRIEVALVVAEAPEVVPWMSRPAHLEARASVLRFTKLPVSWHWRPAEWPVWNHEIDRAVRVWTAPGGRDQSVLDALGSGRLDGVRIEAPSRTDELVAELFIELDVGRRHLASVTESFHDQDWRRAHRGDGVYPEDRLWRATAGFLDLDDAIRRLDH